MPEPFSLKFVIFKFDPVKRALSETSRTNNPYEAISDEIAFIIVSLPNDVIAIVFDSTCEFRSAKDESSTITAWSKSALYISTFDMSSCASSVKYTLLYFLFFKVTVSPTCSYEVKER